MSTWALLREGTQSPIPLTEGLVYTVRCNDGVEYKMTPYNMRMQITDFGGYDVIGPAVLEAPPDGETATRGHGPIEDSVWNPETRQFVCPLLGSEPREEISLEQLAELDRKLRVDQKVQELRTAYPSQNITRAAVTELIEARDQAIAKVEVLEAITVADNGGKALDEIALGVVAAPAEEVVKP